MAERGPLEILSSIKSMTTLDRIFRINFFRLLKIDQRRAANEKHLVQEKWLKSL